MGRRELELAIALCRLQRRTRRPTVVELGRLAELRAAYDAIAETHQVPGGATSQPVVAGGVSAEWIIPPHADPHRVVVYLHGGCYVMGSVETHRELITRIAFASSMRVLGLNYRLAPAHPFPAAVEDVAAAYGWLLASGIDARRIALAGDSAGAGLALATALKIRDDAVPPPAAIVCVSPWTDLAVTGESVDGKASEDPLVNRAMLTGWGKMYLGDHDPRTPLASPLYADLRGLPPILIQAGSAEVLLDDARRLADRASSAGVATTLEVWPEMIHVWHLFAAVLPEAREAIATIARFLRAHLECQ
jgi:epsilon-lactone hydrolase